MDEEGEYGIPGLPEAEQKGKKGKKNKAAAVKKTFTLQNFLHDQENVEPAEQGAAAGQPNQPVSSQSLTEKELAVLESCHSFIHDLLKQLGPTNAMDPAIQQEINNFPPEAKAVMQKLGGYRKFILVSKDLVVVDKIVAARSDLMAAQEMAFKEIYNNIPSDVTISRHQEVSANLSMPKDIWTSSIDTKVPMWNSTNISGAVSEERSLPCTKYDSFLTGGGGQNLELGHFTPSSFNSQSQDSEFLPSTGNNSHSQLFFGGRFTTDSAGVKNGDSKAASYHLNGATVTSPDNSAAQLLEEYQGRIWKLTAANNELLKQLADKENQLKEHHILKQKLQDLDLEHKNSLLQLGAYKTELDKLRLEVGRLRQAEAAQDTDSTNGSGCTPRDVILHLQKQLEQELLKNRNLSQQLEVQHLHLPGENLKLAPESASPHLAVAETKLPRQNTFGGLPTLRREDDLFGLRSMTMNSGPLAELAYGASMGAPPSAFGAIGSDYGVSSRLPLHKSASVANLGFHMSLADSREPSPADFHKSIGNLLGLPVADSTAGVAANLAASSTKSARQEQLVKKLVATIPGSTEDSIKHYIQVLRDQHGKLSGWPTSRIAAEISHLMEMQQ